MARFDDEAIVLDSMPYRDRHLVLTVLTRSRGVVRGVLRGARGGKTPGTAATQLLSRVRVGAFQGAHAEMATFDRVELDRPSFELARSVERSAAAAAVSELLLTFCPPHEPAERHFRLADAAATALLGGVAPATVLAYVQLWVLSLGGVLPPLGECGTCGCELEHEIRVRATDGQPCCPRCAPPAAHLLDAEALAFLVTCRQRPPAEVTGLPPAAARAWLESVARHEAQRPLKALTLYHQLAGDG